MELTDLRGEYGREGLRETDLDADPIRQFEAWMRQRVAAPVPEPGAMILATATPDGRPAARTVLLRHADAQGFVFFTNYESRKGSELAANPRAALLFYWGDLERQIRIEGTVEKVSPEESDAYFATRPRGSRLGAWASEQSRVIAGREVLEERMRRLEAQFAGREVPRPPHWGGYRLVPDRIEFWQGRLNRLHDRLEYVRLPEGGWRLQRLAP